MVKESKPKKQKPKPKPKKKSEKIKSTGRPGIMKRLREMKLERLRSRLEKLSLPD